MGPGAGLRGGPARPRSGDAPRLRVPARRGRAGGGLGPGGRAGDPARATFHPPRRNRASGLGGGGPGPVSRRDRPGRLRAARPRRRDDARIRSGRDAGREAAGAGRVPEAATRGGVRTPRPPAPLAARGAGRRGRLDRRRGAAAVGGAGAGGAAAGRPGLPGRRPAGPGAARGEAGGRGGRTRRGRRAAGTVGPARVGSPGDRRPGRARGGAAPVRLALDAAAGPLPRLGLELYQAGPGSGGLGSWLTAGQRLAPGGRAAGAARLVPAGEGAGAAGMVRARQDVRPPGRVSSSTRGSTHVKLTVAESGVAAKAYAGMVCSLMRDRPGREC